MVSANILSLSTDIYYCIVIKLVIYTPDGYHDITWHVLWQMTLAISLIPTDHMPLQIVSSESTVIQGEEGGRWKQVWRILVRIHSNGRKFLYLTAEDTLNDLRVESRHIVFGQQMSLGSKGKTFRWKTCSEKKGQPQDVLLTLDLVDNSNCMRLTCLCACACSMWIPTWIHVHVKNHPSVHESDWILMWLWLWAYCTFLRAHAVYQCIFILPSSRWSSQAWWSWEGGHSPPSASVYQAHVSRFRVTSNPLTSLAQCMPFPRSLMPCLPTVSCHRQLTLKGCTGKKKLHQWADNYSFPPKETLLADTVLPCCYSFQVIWHLFKVYTFFM